MMKPNNSLDSVVGGIAKAMNGATEGVEKKNRQMLRDYFYADEQGNLNARTVTVMIPSVKDGKTMHAVEMPIFGLVPITPLSVGPVELEVDAHASQPKLDNANDTSLKLDIGKKALLWNPKNNCTVKITLVNDKPLTGDVYIHDITNK